MKSYKCQLRVHDERFSEEDVLVSSDLIPDLQEGDLIEFSHGGEEDSKIIAQITAKSIDKEFLSKHTQLLFSASAGLVNAVELTRRRDIIIQKIDEQSAILDFVEIAFRDQYVARPEMWRLKLDIAGTTVYKGKKISSLGIRAHVKDLYLGGVIVSSGLVTERTRVIFRSETAKYFIFIQISRDMWEFDDDGEMFSEKCVHGFLPELFSKWKEAGVNHVVSIILFTRIFYPHNTESTFAKIYPMSDKKQIVHQSEDSYGRIYNDYYRVIIDWETRSDWSEVLKTIKNEFYRFEKDVLSRRDANGSIVIMGENSHSSEGNILEAINLALNPFDKHFIDRDLLRTGLSTVIITAGVGFFETEQELSKITSQRMIESGIGLDLVCLSKIPLFSTPLFQFFASEIELDNNYSTDDHASTHIYSASDRVSDPSLFESRTLHNPLNFAAGRSNQSMKRYYWMPNWIDCSYWSRPNIMINPDVFTPRCKMPDIQILGSEPIIAPLIDDFIFPLKSNEDGQTLPLETNEEYDAYDDAVFETVSRKLQSNLSGSVENRISMLSEKVKYDGNPFTKASSYSSDLSPSHLDRHKKIDATSKSASYDHLESSNYTTSMIPIKIRLKNESPPVDHGGRSLASSMVRSPSERHYMRPSPRKASFSQYRQTGEGLNPLKIGQIDNKAYHPWRHVLPKSLNDKPVMDWKSLCTPACFPITTDYFPTQEELSNFYQEYTYSVSWADDAIYQGDLINEQEKVGALLIELISQRLAQGYQLIQPFSFEGKKSMLPPGSETNIGPDTIPAGKISISVPHYLSLGNQVHRLFYDSSGKNVEVKRYVKKNISDSASSSYYCFIWPKYNDFYGAKKFTFSYSSSARYNWNYLDHLISGYQDEMTENLRFWRTRYLLIPLESDKISKNNFSLSSTPTNEVFDEEEVLVAGFLKFADLFDKYQCDSKIDKEKTNASRFEKKRINITITTFDAAFHVRSELLRINQGDKSEGKDTTSSKEGLTKTKPFEIIAHAMQQLEGGVNVRDRLWHFITYRNVFIGKDCVDWFIQNFSDIDSREDAVNFGNQLLSLGHFEHVLSKHGFLDGHYFYRINQEYLSQEILQMSKGSSNLSWFKALSRSHLEISNAELEQKSIKLIQPREKKFRRTERMVLDMDPNGVSPRREISILHYETLFNPKNCFGFQIHWLICTARLIETMLHTWSRTAEKCGFRLTEAPIQQAMPFADINPFQSVISIEFSIPPPKISSDDWNISLKEIPDEWYERELLKKFDFVLDSEADSLFKNVEYSYLRTSFVYTQFIHRSGAAIVQIIPGQGLRWVKNRLHLTSINSLPNRAATHSLKTGLIRQELIDFVKDSEALSNFWKEKTKKLLQILRFEPESAKCE